MSRISITKHHWIMAGSVILLIAGAATAAVYITKDGLNTRLAEPAPPKNAMHQHIAGTSPVAPVQRSQPCDDGNVLGVAAGGIAGGLVGSQVGKGRGNIAATIGGTLGGAYLGGQYLPLRGTACRQ